MFTKEQLEKKISDFDANIASMQSEINYIQTDAQQRINQKLAELNKTTGKKEIFEDMLAMVNLADVAEEIIEKVADIVEKESENPEPQEEAEETPEPDENV